MTHDTQPGMPETTADRLVTYVLDFRGEGSRAKYYRLTKAGGWA